MLTFWQEVTAPQATIIAGLCTLAAALFGVLVGWWLFNGRVKDLKSAIEASDKLVKEHTKQLEASLTNIRASLSDLQLQFSTTLEALGQLRGSVGDIQSSTIEEPATQAQADRREQLRAGWIGIRDKLEEMAADPNTDGRTRAKYARIDRRKYSELVNALARDNALDGNQDRYMQAVNIWMRYRNGRREPTKTDADALSGLRTQLAPPRAAV